MKGTKDIVKFYVFRDRSLDFFKVYWGCNQLTSWSDCVDTILVFVGCYWQDFAGWVAKLIACVVTYRHRNGITVLSQQSPLITIVILEDYELGILAYDKTVLCRVDCVNSLPQGWFKDVGLVLTIFGTENHFSIVCADQDHSSALRPGMASEISRNISPLF